MATRKKISNKKELELAELLNFKGVYLDTLLKRDECQGKGDSLLEILKNIKKERRERAAERAATERKRFGDSNQGIERMKEKARAILNSFDTGHSMGCTKDLYLKIGKRAVDLISLDCTSEYSRSSRWKATHGHLAIGITKQQLKNIEKVHNVWTVRLDNGKAIWLEEEGSKQYYSVKWVEGFIYKNSHSYVSLSDAKRLHFTSKGNYFNKKSFVGIADLKKVGACDVGINAFVKKHNLNKDFGYRLDYLKSLEESYYLNKLG